LILASDEKTKAGGIAGLCFGGTVWAFRQRISGATLDLLTPPRSP
jgi:hypothetical protein